MTGSLKATASALCAAALLVVGCGSSAPKQTPTATLTRAAYVSSAAPGYKLAMSLRETIPSVGQVTASGTGSIRLFPVREGSMTMRFNVPGAAASSSGLSNLQLQAVLVPGSIYMKLPPQLASRIPGGKPWVQINLSQLGKAAGLPGLGSLINNSSSMTNPGQYLDYLRAASSGTVKDLGQATVDWVKTTHYHAIVDLTKVPAAVPASERPAVQQLVAALRSHGASTRVPVNVWIDAAHRIRRYEMGYTLTVNGQQVNAATRIDMLSYGPQPAPKVPPANQTQNLLALTGGRP